MSDGTEPRTEEQKGAKGMHEAAGHTPAQLLFRIRPDPLKLIAQGPCKKRSCYPLNVPAMGVPIRKIYSKHLKNKTKTRKWKLHALNESHLSHTTSTKQHSKMLRLLTFKIRKHRCILTFKETLLSE